MSRILVITVLFITVVLQGCGGGGGAADNGGMANTGGNAGSTGGCDVAVDPSLGLKAVAHQFHALQSRCGLTDAQVEEKIGEL
jgi:hypothetical protein